MQSEMENDLQRDATHLDLSPVGVDLAPGGGPGDPRHA